MIDRLNTTTMMHSLVVEPTRAIGGMTNFPGHQENLARFPASAFRRMNIREAGSGQQIQQLAQQMGQRH